MRRHPRRHPHSIAGGFRWRIGDSAKPRERSLSYPPRLHRRLHPARPVPSAWPPGRFCSVRPLHRTRRFHTSSEVRCIRGFRGESLKGLLANRVPLVLMYNRTRTPSWRRTRPAYPRPPFRRFPPLPHTCRPPHHGLPVNIRRSSRPPPKIRRRVSRIGGLT